ALVWGASAKHNPQRVGKEHVLVDEDVVQILKRIQFGIQWHNKAPLDTDMQKVPMKHNGALSLVGILN
ncbi:hypothetical protein OSTOST_19910, partial [Ostertagia ostertagi]